MAILTVGKNQAYTSIAAAVAASSGGDTIDVMAGTYTNDFPTIRHDLTIQGVDGPVNLVAAAQPPNGKAIIVEGASGISVTLSGLTMSGASVPDANGAGIRYEGGTLTLINDTFTGNQNGILGAADPNGVITISNSTFNLNGSGTGYTHNIYVGAIASLTVQNSTVENALAGHDIKSRAAVNVITGNTITDTSGTASYEIDIANGGVATITGNVIEKGRTPQNPFGITYGEEGASYAANSLTVTGNVIVNDFKGGSTTAIRNSVGSVTATVSKNTFYGWTTLTSGNVAMANNTVATTEPALTMPSAQAPSIAGTLANQLTKAEAPVMPFSGVTIGDGNSGATDTLTVTVGGAGGTLAGAGLATGNSYRLTGSAAAITRQLAAVTFTPAKGAPSTSATSTFALSLASSAYATPVTDSTTTVVNRDPPAVSITAPAAGTRFGVVTPTVTGTADLLEAGRSVSLTSGGAVIGTAVVAADGTWSDRLALPGDGTYAITASVINAAGDSGSAASSFIVDSSGNAGLFGATSHDASSTGGVIYALYQIVLGRAPDTLGFEGWVAAAQNGMALADMAQHFVDCPEYAAKFGATTQADSAFVHQIYANGMRQPLDSSAMPSWAKLLDAGMSRGQVVAAFATSAEMRAGLAAVFQAGVFVPSAADSSVARLYYGLLGRAPDAGGLQNWVSRLSSGESLTQMGQDFLNSVEYAAGHAGLTNAGFVDAIYRGTLGHGSGGDAVAQNWINALNGGASRASVGVAISEGTDAAIHLLPAIQQGYHLAS